jgi:hypothetical protein
VLDGKHSHISGYYVNQINDTFKVHRSSNFEAKGACRGEANPLKCEAGKVRDLKAPGNRGFLFLGG